VVAGRIRRGPRNLAAGPLRIHVGSLVLHLRSEGKSDNTVTVYTDADMLRFEPVRDGGARRAGAPPVLVGTASHGQWHYDQVMKRCA
jgi:hypothetical protein